VEPWSRVPPKPDAIWISVRHAPHAPASARRARACTASTLRHHALDVAILVSKGKLFQIQKKLFDFVVKKGPQAAAFSETR
jgi:hypothetical protein